MTPPFFLRDLAAFLLSLTAACVLATPSSASVNAPPGRTTLDLSGPGWTLWRDSAAAWENDELYLPPVDPSKVPTNAPTGGWESLASKDAVPVAVPGTAEEYLGKGKGPDSMVKGVTWWVRTFQTPTDAQGKTIRLLFDSVRQRAEVYVNRKLVGYDLVGDTPFEVDLTGVVKPGENVQLAVRITNPGGNFAWVDETPIFWGKFKIPMGRGFGGVTGRVRLAVTDPVYINDLSIQNTPAKTSVNVIATVKNTAAGAVSGSALVSIREKATGKEVFQKELSSLDFKPGETTVVCPVSLPGAKLWDLEHPNLYEALFTLSAGSKNADSDMRIIGFRWFSPEGIGSSNALLRLNGKRVVLRTAISWGLWPITGIIPTPELAARQIASAKAYGLNMLNFHRCIGNPIVFDKADEMGLLYFEEPGAYLSGGKDPFSQALAREKLLRMVKRDRSHPSLIIYNMINEAWYRFGADKDEALFAIHRDDLQKAHALDPSRVIVYASAWAKEHYPTEEKAKMNMQPFDETVHMNGWWDKHRAGGPEVWKQDFYQSPSVHYGFTDDRAEVVYWGEEGALSAPPRLGLIEKELRDTSKLGWDGQVYRDWHKAFDDYLTANNLRSAFPTVDDLCKAMGVVSIEHQGRKIEDTRICDANDGYAVNGWESTLVDNHSGVVDCFRNPKADPAIMAYYNQPLYVAVKPRQQITSFPGSVTVDFFLINEKDLKGPLTLRIRATTRECKESFSKEIPVTAQGGDVYGQLLSEAVEIPLTAMEGMTTIAASLVDAQGTEKANGHDQVLAVEWKSIPITGKGAVFEDGSRVRDFLKKQKGIDAPLFDNSQPKLDWLIVAKPFVKDPETIAAEAFLQPDGKTPGLKTSFFAGEDFTQAIFERVDPKIEFSVSNGETPSTHVSTTENYSVRWDGQLMPPEDGEYVLVLKYREGAHLWVDGKPLLNEAASGGKPKTKQFKMILAAGKPVPIRVESIHKDGDAQMQMLWQTPIPEKIGAEQVLARAARDGTTVLILDRAENWIGPVCKAMGLPQGGSFQLGNNWLGGQYFVTDHPLFAGLPVNQALNWPYQGVIGGKRTAFKLQGGQLIVGAYHTWPLQLGSAVSIVPAGKGKIILSSLDLIGHLGDSHSPAEVARKLFCNFLNYAATSGQQTSSRP